MLSCWLDFAWDQLSRGRRLLWLRPPVSTESLIVGRYGLQNRSHL